MVPRTPLLDTPFQMTSYSTVPTKRRPLLNALARLSLLLVFVSCAWGIGGVFHEVRAQEGGSACTDTLAAAEKAYRNRNYQEAVTLASGCTDPETVREDTAIRAHRVITLASLRRGALVQARSAVENILQIDPTYMADPVSDPPSYDLFVSMVREEMDVEGAEDMKTGDADAGDTTDVETSGERDAETVGTKPPPPQSERTVDLLFIKPLGIGFSDYTGDMPAQNVGHPFDFQEFSRGSGVPFMLHGELGYQFAPRWGLVLGVQVGNYPIVGYSTGSGDISDSWRYTPQLLVRYAFGTLGESVVVYLDGGGNVTFGGAGVAKAGYGPSVGGGVDIPVSNALSLYVESRFNFTFPDDAIDGSAPANNSGFGGSFDMVNQLLGVGLRIRFGGS
jgi:hypothetical protein